MSNQTIKINTTLSKKLKIISFYMMVLIVFLHAFNLGYSNVKPEYDFFSYINSFIQNFISQGVSRSCVPLFFAISGIMFFKSFELTFKSYKFKVFNRFKTLFIPFILWSVIGILLIYFLQIIPFTQKYFTKKIELSFDIMFKKPIAFQLWFIRDLFVLVLISPILGYLNKKLGLFWIILLFFAWVFGIPTIIIRSFEPILFFTFGGYLVNYNFNLVTKRVPLKFAFITIGLWVFLLFFKLLIIENYFDSITYIFHKLTVFVGVISIWQLFDFVQFKFFTRESFFQTTFFIYLFHELFLTIFRKILLKKMDVLKYLTGGR